MTVKSRAIKKDNFPAVGKRVAILLHFVCAGAYVVTDWRNILSNDGVDKLENGEAHEYCRKCSHQSVNMTDG
jgi:hypothetical protein